MNIGGWVCVLFSKSNSVVFSIFTKLWISHVKHSSVSMSITNHLTIPSPILPPGDHKVITEHWAELPVLYTGPCWFSMLNTAVGPCPSQTPWLSLPHPSPWWPQRYYRVLSRVPCAVQQVLAGSPCYIQCFRLFDPTFSPSFSRCCCCVLFSDIHFLEETPQTHVSIVTHGDVYRDYIYTHWS